jgi:hypothetical protein
MRLPLAMPLTADVRPETWKTRVGQRIPYDTGTDGGEALIVGVWCDADRCGIVVELPDDVGDALVRAWFGLVPADEPNGRRQTRTAHGAVGGA